MNTSIASTLLNTIKVNMQEAMYWAFDHQMHAATCDMESIEITVNVDEQVNVKFYDEDGNEKNNLPLLREAITKAVPLWGVVADEWEADRNCYDDYPCWATINTL